MDVGERYVLGRLVGEGATACVYEARDTVLRREVAVKVFRNPDIGDSGSQRIDEEIRILASLGHPHLLPIYDSGRDAQGHRFIVMPLVRGTTLAKLVADGPVRPPEVKRIGKALADALSHVHSRGIVHRDVKPSNVLLAEDGTPFLADFGFAHAVDSPALTTTGCVVGTAGYLAPEQAEGLPVTPAVDVYALGLVLLEALTGERAYRGTPLERATANALRPPHIPARLGPGWLKVLRTLTAKDPSARLSAEAVNALLDVGEDELPVAGVGDDTMELPAASSWSSPLSLSGASEPAAGRPRHPHRRHHPHTRRLAVMGAVTFTALAVVAVGADWLTPGASARTGVPVPATPGAGAAGAQPTTATAPPRAATSVSPSGNAPSQSFNVDQDRAAYTRPASKNTPPAPKKCQGGDGQNADGHGKHECHGGGGGGGKEGQ